MLGLWHYLCDHDNEPVPIDGKLSLEKLKLKDSAVTIQRWVTDALPGPAFRKCSVEESGHKKWCAPEKVFVCAPMA